LLATQALLFGEEQVRAFGSLLDELASVSEVLAQVAVVNLIHDLSIDLSELNVRLHAVFPQKGDHRLELEQDRLLIDLKIRLRLSQVV